MCNSSPEFGVVFPRGVLDSGVYLTQVLVLVNIPRLPCLVAFLQRCFELTTVDRWLCPGLHSSYSYFVWFFSDVSLIYKDRLKADEQAADRAAEHRSTWYWLWWSCLMFWQNVGSQRLAWDLFVRKADIFSVITILLFVGLKSTYVAVTAEKELDKAMMHHSCTMFPHVSTIALAYIGWSQVWGFLLLVELLPLSCTAGLCGYLIFGLCNRHPDVILVFILVSNRLISHRFCNSDTYSCGVYRNAIHCITQQYMTYTQFI